MTKLSIFVVSTVLGYVGWFLGNPLGFGWAIVISGIGSIYGVYLGWKIGRRFE
jgi:ABC-type lipoprotein release transport system permease subunit